MSITIAIPTFNRADSLADTLRSLRGLVVPAGCRCQVLVVNNACTDRTPEVVQAASAWLPFPVRQVVEDRPGLCFGRNRALVETMDDHVVYLDDDVHVGREWLVGYARAVQTLGADCVVGPVRPVFPEPLPPYATAYVLSLIGSNYSRKGEQMTLLAPERSSEVPGCNFGVRREVALSVGGFDNSLDRIGSGLLAGGDSEFGIRLSKAGKRIIYVPECGIDHLIGRDKLDQDYLRRRAAGLGRTSASLHAMHGEPISIGEWVRPWKRALGLWVRWQRRRFGGRVDAFEWELRTRRHVAGLAASFAVRAVSTRGEKATTASIAGEYSS